MFRTGIFLIAILAAASFLGATDDDPLRIGPVTAQPGNVAWGVIEVTGTKARLPITVIQGAQPGPVLAVIAVMEHNLHPAVATLGLLRKQVDPKDLRGAFIIVRVQSLEAIFHHVGSRQATEGSAVAVETNDEIVATRIAQAIASEVIAKCDYIINIHWCARDMPFTQRVEFTRTGKTKLDTVASEMALAFGIERIFVNHGISSAPFPTLRCAHTATALGKPGIALETSLLAFSSDDDANPIVAGVKSVMRYFNMIDGVPRRTQRPIYIESSSTMDK
jgi:uncharacterized protein